MSTSDLAFVEEVENRIASVESLALLSPSEQREKRLCTIVREQNASIFSLQGKLVDETAQRELVEAERDALRERLTELTRHCNDLHRPRMAALEAAAKLGLLHEASVCDEGCDCVDCQCLEALGALELKE